LFDKLQLFLQKEGKFEGMKAENEEIKDSKFAKPMRPHKLLSNA